ncbi:ATP-binding protein [Glutamicibacter sp.]|uniref:ATP-binding protein n=1 Tax=Glutamicibacter sp. TaxID=1931995 RepID=UPI0028BE1204|nr:ATP-binding protein [Glutamicibacter sp.]
MQPLSIGTPVGDDDGQVQLNASKFNRHTFWCGQSGSGKTYALGVVLEQLILKTQLPILVMDPNADFTKLEGIRPEADADEAQKIKDASMHILNTTSAEGPRLQIRFTDFSVASKAAILQLDPVLDAEEYNVLVHLDGTEYDFDDDKLISTLRGSGDPGKIRLANRVENLQVLDWGLWSRGAASATDIIESRPRVTVMDLGGFGHHDEPKVAALGMLEHLWATRQQRKPVLIVIDEAHNLCSPNPVTPVEKALTEQLIQIAAEGRKFGLWLFLSTQRPTKIHPNVLSQCDNLGLMRVNSPRDLAEIGEVFGFVPTELLNQAKYFAQGQGLFAGGFISEPTVNQMRDRITQEGGSDVKVPLA